MWGLQRTGSSLCLVKPRRWFSGKYGSRTNKVEQKRSSAQLSSSWDRK